MRKIIVSMVIFFSWLLERVLFLLKEIFFSPIVVNATVYTLLGKIKHFNFGDDLNWFLLKKIQPHKIVLFRASILSKRPSSKKENFLIIGSTITFLTNEKTVIWGAGVIDDNQPLCAKPKRVCAVRGPLTRKYLLENGVDCPPVYGDPALLTKYFYKPVKEKKYKLGIIPHYVDFFSEKFNLLKKDPDILFIKMQKYESAQNVINQITTCERILSSSLHGLILSESYNVPNLWLKVSENIKGGSFKYLDYYESMGIQDAKPYLLDGNESIHDLLSLFADYKRGHIDLRPLIEAAPFELNLKVEDLQ